MQWKGSGPHRNIVQKKLNVLTANIYKKKEILEVKHKRNVTFLEAKKIVGSYMGENTYASITWRVDPIKQSNQADPIGTKWLVKVSGAPEKPLLSWILASTNSTKKNHK